MTKYLKYIFLILWIGIIFAFSSQRLESSKELSGNITIFLEKFLNFSDKNFDYHNLIRKFAHFINYMILGVIIALVLKKMELENKKIFLFSLLFCILIAFLDEYYQSFIPGRGARLKDVFIDSFGALVGVGLGQLKM